MQPPLTLPRLLLALFTACVLAVAPVSGASSSTKPAARPKVTLNVSKAQVISPGESVTLVASATNATAYQWYKGNQAIEGATSLSYAASADGSYLCQVSGPGGTAKSKAVKVSVAYAPVSIAGRTLILSGDFRSVGRDTLEGSYDETSSETVTLEVSSNGRSLLVITEDGDEDEYALTYKRSGNRATLTARGSFSYSDEVNSGSYTESLTLTLNLSGYNSEEDFVTGTFTIRGSARGSYTYEDESGRTKRATVSETLTGNGTVALD